MSALDKIQQTIYEFLVSKQEIAQNFSDIYTSPKIFPQNDSLMIDLVNVEEVEYYGYFILTYVFGIVTDKRSKALFLLDCLLKHVNKQYYKNANKNVSVYFYYTGNYDEVLDTSQNRILITTLWRVRATFI